MILSSPVRVSELIQLLLEITPSLRAYLPPKHTSRDLSRFLKITVDGSPVQPDDLVEEGDLIECYLSATE